MAQRFTNNAISSLAKAVSTSERVVTLANGEGAKFPTLANGDDFLLTVFQRTAGAEANHEIMRCTARAGDVLTVERGQEGTEPHEYKIGDPAELRLTAGAVLPVRAGALTGPLNEAPPVTMVCAASMAIGAAGSNTITVTGSAEIVAFDAVPAGVFRRLIFNNDATIRGNPRSGITLFGTAPVAVVDAKGVAEFVSMGGGKWTMTSLSLRSGNPVELPLATPTTPGAVKIGANLSMDASGALNAPATPEDGYAVGDVMFSAAPKGKKFLPADGRVYSQNAYPELYAAIGVGHVFPSVMLDHQYYSPVTPMSISYSSDGKYLICAYSNQTGRGILLGKREGNTYTIVSNASLNTYPQFAKFVPSSNYIVVGDYMGIRLFHMENEVISEIPSAYVETPEGIFTIGFSEDGKKFALGGGSQTYAYSLGNEKFTPLEVYGESGTSTIAFAAMSPDGTFIVSAHNGGSNLRAFFWDANTQRYDRMGTNWGDINTDYSYGSTVQVAITKDQNYIISCWDGAPYLQVHRRNGFDFTAVDNLNIVQMQASGMAVSINEDYIAISGNVPPYLAAYSYDDGVIAKLSPESFSPAKIPSNVEFSPDGKHLAMLYTYSRNYSNPDKSEKLEILHSLLPYDPLFEFQVPNNKPTPGRVESTSKTKAYIKAKS